MPSSRSFGFRLALAAGLLPLLLLLLVSSPSAAFAQADRDAAAYAQTIAQINDEHLRSPDKIQEDALAKRLSPMAKSALQRVLQAKPSPSLVPALSRCAEAALDLSLADDFQAARSRLETVAPDEATKVGTAVFRPRFIVRGIGGFAPGYLDRFADLFDAILASYDEVFGFEEFSKVPGKKLRIRLHLEPVIKNPPHFAPEFPWHSEIDFPVVDPAEFRSPTRQGQFLFYGLCHELGHLIAMWGDPSTMEDHHIWAHYTGVVITEHMAAKFKDGPLLKAIHDDQWRSLEEERKAPENQVPPSLKDAPGVMALLIALHDSIGPHAIGDALNWLDHEGKARRINRVRYYSFADLKCALGAVLKDNATRQAALKLFP